MNIEELTTLNDIKLFLYENGNRIFPFEDLNAIGRKVMATCPSAGEGVHHWLFEAARIFHHKPFYLKDGRIKEVLAKATEDCGREIEPHEIEDAVRNSNPLNIHSVVRVVKGNRARVARPIGKWPDKDDELIGDILDNYHFTIEELIEKSPLEAHALTTVQILEILYPEKPLLAFASSDKFQSWAIRWSDPKSIKATRYPPLMVR